MKPTLIIDAGHGGWDFGASYEGRLEKEDNLQLALLVGKTLEQDGYPVFYTRTNDIYQAPSIKAQIGNASGGDYFVSFHRNAAETPGTYNGVQVLVYDEESPSFSLAQNVLSNMVEIGFQDLGIKERPELAVLRRTKMPAILIEAGFIDSEKDNALWDESLDELAVAIANGIIAGIGFSEEDTEDSPHLVSYGVQVGLFRRVENAVYMRNALERRGYDGRITDKYPYYAVVVGTFDNVDEARDLERQLRSDGFDTLLVSEEFN